MVLQKTSYPGVYFEFRGQSGAADADFAVVWLPGQDGPAAKHTFETCARAVALTCPGANSAFESELRMNRRLLKP